MQVVVVWLINWSIVACFGMVNFQCDPKVTIVIRVLAKFMSVFILQKKNTQILKTPVFLIVFKVFCAKIAS